jgi:hypothetical protein
VRARVVPSVLMTYARKCKKYVKTRANNDFP